MMLLRRTFIYMPAQIMGPLAQFLAAAIWTYFLAPEAFGTYVLVWAIQELALLLVLSWWSAYALRYITSHNDDILRFDGVEIAIQLAATVLQTLFVALALLVVFHELPGMNLLAATLAFTLTRNLTWHFADRSRASSAILAYTILNSCGSVLGLAFGIVAVLLFAPTPEIVLWSYALAQALGLVLAWSFIRTSTLRPRLDLSLVRGAFAYGAPLMIGNALAWVAMHGLRFVVEHEQGLAGVGLISVGWWLGMRATTFTGQLATTAGFTLAVEKVREAGQRAALPQLASNGALLLAALIPTVAGVIMLNAPLVDALVSEPYRAITRDILPLAIATGAVRIFRIHATDQCFLLFNRPKLDIIFAGAEAVLVLLACYIGLRLDGGRGAVMGCLIANAIVTLASFVTVNRIFGYYLRSLDVLRVVVAVAAMMLVLHILPPAHSRVELVGHILAGAITFALAIAAGFPRTCGLAIQRLLSLRPSPSSP